MQTSRWRVFAGENHVLTTRVLRFRKLRVPLLRREIRFPETNLRVLILCQLAVWLSAGFLGRLSLVDSPCEFVILPLFGTLEIARFTLFEPSMHYYGHVAFAIWFPGWLLLPSGFSRLDLLARHPFDIGFFGSIRHFVSTYFNHLHGIALRPGNIQNGSSSGLALSLFRCHNRSLTHSCISVGTTSGYKIYNCDPFGKCYGKTDGGISISQMLFCTSLVALVGGGPQPAFSPRKLRLVNTKRQSTICELTFVTSVLKVMMNRKRLVVVLEEHIYVYDIGNMKLLMTLDTNPNPNGGQASEERATGQSDVASCKRALARLLRDFGQFSTHC